jgi:HSP20 family protein
MANAVAPLSKVLEDLSGFTPKVDIKETEKEVVITAEVAGVQPEDLEVKVYGDNLILSGEKKEEKEEKLANYYHMERRYGSFQRVLPLPAGANRDAIEATTSHGVLTVKIPKTNGAKDAGKKIEVKAK